MLIVALTGPSAVGKTSVTRLLAEKFDVLHESYMEQNVHGLDNRHVISKWAYIGAWFDLIYRRASAGCHVLLTDRSPYDTCAYVDHETECLLRVVRRSMEELTFYRHSVKTLLLTADVDVLMERIRDRLQQEPARFHYHEADPVYCQRVHQYFGSHSQLWDVVIHTTGKPLLAVADAVAAQIDEWKR